jgi:hypothetical protein
MFIISTGTELVDFIKDFTGSTNDTEIKQCIFMAEMSMRNIELPALRCDPYAQENIGVADANGRIPIPGDMNKPILFFKQGQQVSTTATATGTISQYTILLTSTPAQTISNNMSVTGTGIGSGATISNVSTGISGATITLSVANSGAVSGTLTFATTGNSASQTGPWIVYDRIGDRDIITQGMIAQLYLQPVNVPAVIRGKFSEVYSNYQFLPYVAEGDLINLYYYKAWPLLFAPVTDEVISATGTVGSISGTGPWTFTITNMTTVGDLEVGNEIYALAGSGSFGSAAGVTTVTSILGATSITATTTGGTTPTNGTVTGITQTGLIVENNAVLQTWPEGYVYSTLREYYIKRHNETDAQIYQAKFDAAWNVVSDQNSLGKWSGGHTRLTSVWQPRQYRQYSTK